MSNRTPFESVMNAHRLHLGMRWKDVLAAADGMAAETLRRVRLHGTDAVDDFSVARLDRALQLQPGGLREMEAQANSADASEETGSPPAPEGWEGEIIGPDAPLREGEELRWRTESGKRVYELTVRGLSFEAGLSLDSTPEGVIGDLRRVLADRVAQVSGDLLRSHSGA